MSESADSANISGGFRSLNSSYDDGRMMAVLFDFDFCLHLVSVWCCLISELLKMRLLLTSYGDVVVASDFSGWSVFSSTFTLLSEIIANGEIICSFEECCVSEVERLISLSLSLSFIFIFFISDRFCDDSNC